MSWDDFVHEFIESHRPRKPPTTIRAYEMCLQAFGRTAKPASLGKINVATLEDFANARLGDHKSPATVNKDLRHVRSALRWAKRRGYLNEAPSFHGVFVRENKRKPTVMPEQDFLAIVQALDQPTLTLAKRSKAWWRIFLYVSYYLGLRRAETLGLTWDCITFPTREVRIVAETSKGRRERVLPIPEGLIGLLEDWRRHAESSGQQSEVFPWPFDNYRQLYEDWHTIQNAAGIAEGHHYLPKHCRSSCASQLIAAGVATAVVKDFLGHRHITTTDNYYINTQPAMRSAAAARKVVLVDSCRTSVELAPKTVDPNAPENQP